MRKVIKISFHVLSGLIITLITLPVALALLLQLSSVQNFVVRQAARMASERLETTVSFDRIHIRFFNRVVIDGLYVEDMQRDTLLYARRLDIGIATPRVLLGDLSFGELKLTDVRFNMYQEADSTSNFRKILDRLSSGEPGRDRKPTKIRAAGIAIENMHYSYRKYVVPPREHGVNFSDVDVREFNLAAREVSILGDSISMRIDNIALGDKSGFVLDGLSSREFAISGAGIFFDGLHMATPDSEVEMERLRLITGTWQGYNDFTKKVRIESAISDSRVAFRTIAYFAPGLKDWNMVVDRLEGELNGTVADMSGRITSARMNDTELAFDFSMRGIPDIRNTHFKLGINRLVTNAADIDAILHDVTGKGISDDLAGNAGSLGTVEFSGGFDGTLNSFTARGNLATEDGSGDFNVRLTPSGNGLSALAGEVDIREVGLGRLLGIKDMGRLSFNAAINGTMGRNQLMADASAMVTSFEYRGYRYRNISMNGLFRNKQFRGNIGSNDPNVKFDFDGMFDLNDAIPRFDFGLRLSNVDLAALNLNRRDSISVFRGNITVAGSGSSLDNMNGSIDIDELFYVNHLDSISTEKIRITGENSPASKCIALRSSFADADYRSRKSYTEIFRDLRGMLQSYMPTLASSGSLVTSYGDRTEDVENYSMLNVYIKKANNVAGIFVPGLIIAQGSKLSFMFNPNAEQFSLTASSDYLEFGGNSFISNLELNTRNQNDSISLFIRASDLYASGIYMPDFSVIAALRENHANATMRLRDTTQNMTALIGLAATLDRDSLTGMPQARLRMTPSTVTIRGRTWNIYTRGIVIDSTRVVVNSFNIAGAGQSLRVDGVASRSRSDTLSITLSRFDLEPITQFTSPMGYKIKGQTSGQAKLMSALERGILHAGINFDSVSVNGVELPPGRFESTWDFEQERARFLLTGRETQDTVILGFYNPADNRYFARVGISDLDLSLLDPLLSGVLAHSSGSAGINAVMTGSGRSPKINGSIDIKEFSTSIDFLRVPYTIRDSRIEVEDNVMTATDMSVWDPGGNRAGLDMNVDLSSLSNIRYSFNIRPSNVMVLNTTALDNNLFYGRAFVSGAAAIRGDRGGINMNITVRTDDNSEIFLPLSDDSSLGLSDIITFRAREKDELEESDYLARSRRIMQRSRRITEAATRTNMNVNMALSVLPNTRFQLLIDPKVGDVLEGRGRGSLTMNINPATGEFNMFGNYEITEGSYQFTLQDIISRRFTIEPGSMIRWTGDPADAILDVTAVYRLTASLNNILYSQTSAAGDRRSLNSVPVECRIMLSGRLSNPTVTFSVDVDADPTTRIELANTLGTQENMATQFFFLLATGGFYSFGGGMGSIGSEMGASAAIGILNNQINNLMANDNFNLGIRYTPRGELNSDEVMVDFSTRLFGNRLLLEVEGNYDSRNNPGITTGTRNNLTGDFYVTWLLDPSGNLRLRGFTRTIDRFDENQGLQESGIGIYYKEDFNTFNDIVRNFRQRFSGWGRKRKSDQAPEGAGAAVGQTEDNNP